MTNPFAGPIEAKVRGDLEALTTAHPLGEALSESAIQIARKLDRGVEDKAIAGVFRELRATLNDLARWEVPGSDDLGDELSTPVRDAEDG